MVFPWDDSRAVFRDAAQWFVHTADLATALGAPLDVPATAATQALELVTDLAVSGGRAGPLLLAATGRPLPSGLSVL